MILSALVGGAFTMKSIRVALRLTVFWVLAFAGIMGMALGMAWGACDMPGGVGVEGEMIYNKDWKVMQFCDGSKWVAMNGGGGGGTAPSGAIMAFDLEECPSGWSIYTAAQGRFLRGIDPSGTLDIDGVRAVGNVQTSQIQDHQHTMFAGNGGLGSGIVGGAAGYWGSISGTSGHGQSGFVMQIPGNPVRTAPAPSETRPVNVAVLYCRKD